MCACSDGFALSLRVAGKRGGLKEGRGEGEGGREGGKGRWEREGNFKGRGRKATRVEWQ